MSSDELEEKWEEIVQETGQAAIQAMREVTPEMVRAGNLSGFNASVKTVSEDVWQAMIDAALSPHP